MSFTEEKLTNEDRYHNVEKKFLEAMGWLERNDFAEARKVLLDIVKENDQFPNPYTVLGWIYYSKFNNDSQAEKYYKKGIEVDPNYLPTYYSYINFLIERSRIVDAKRLLETLEKKEGIALFEVFWDHALICEMEEDYSQAIAYYKKAIRKSLNNDSLAKMNEGILRCKKKRISKNPLLDVTADQQRSVTILTIVVLAFLVVVFVCSQR